MDIKGKVAMVTGGAAGIGRAYCEELLKNGAKVSICDINEEVGVKLADLLGAKFGNVKVIFCPCDVTDYPQFQDAFRKTIAAFGGLDIVVNNAGVFNDRFWEFEVDVNLNGVIRGTLLAMQLMGKDKGGRGGTVVVTSSTMGYKPCPSMPIYTATKHALIGFIRSFGDPYHTNLTGIRVIALCPGMTLTDAIPEDVKLALLSPNFIHLWDKDVASQAPQAAQSVGRALIHVLQKAQSGSVWVAENNKSAKEVKFPNF
ncbi:15-hydroxyprostaglandin dehydrogenase [NAD(+)]-like [Melanaphis sacchari]|uniref:15-hydroxyprostaglandin dehydrogenase [NAD(+)] n=1 Tax=Melanaphis sacchari TaxID=742174 RepID=A0A2H8TFE7_9HEMI|nr:15-hydroxyprostaglandin dehydrogenase [NAD(+)]-like [Melanaphis sacchari]